jgi:hypothetical protein
MFKKIIPLIIAVVVSGGLFFYVGMLVGQGSKSATVAGQFGSGNFQTNALGAAGARRGGGQNGGFVAGQIIAKDATTLTIQLAAGGSKIVLYSDATTVQKSTQGTVADLNSGEQVSITGTANSDGSVTAQSVQIRPTIATTQNPSTNQ